MDKDRFYDRIEQAAYLVIILSAVIIAFVWSSGCSPAPPVLSPEAKAAFHATRVVQVLDVFRDAAIAANDGVPPLLTTDSTRKVVLWHKSAVKTIRAVPTGWEPVVRAGLFELTCHPLAAPVPPPAPPPPCTPLLRPSEVQHLTPYVGLALVVINEVF
jgi:hypothetical protein